MKEVKWETVKEFEDITYKKQMGWLELHLIDLK